MKIGLCQTETIEGELEGNFRRVLADIRAAAERGAELIVTPECVLSGYAGSYSDDEKARFAETAVTLKGSEITAVRDIARETGVDIVFGFAEKAEAGKFHNTAAFIGREGDIVFAYRKIHCRMFESANHDGLFTPGDEFFVAERRYSEGAFSIGAMICFDREIVESVRCLRALGAVFVACPLATNTYPLNAAHAIGQRADNETVTRVRAAENEVAIAVVNHAARFNGGSYVVGPLGETVVQLGAAAEVAVVEVPLGEVQGKFHADPLGWMGWGFRRPDVYGKYLG